MAAVSVVAFAALLSSCGGGGGSSPVATMDDDTTMTPDDTPPTTPPTTIMGQIIPSGTTLTLPPGHGLQEGTLRAKMGETVTLRDDEGNVIVSGTCNDVDCSADLTGDTVTLVGAIELVEANALVLALLTDLLPPDPADLNELETAQAAAARCSRCSDDCGWQCQYHGHGSRDGTDDCGDAADRRNVGGSGREGPPNRPAWRIPRTWTPRRHPKRPRQRTMYRMRSGLRSMPRMLSSRLKTAETSAGS